MSQLEALPAEIRVQIYNFVFQDTHIQPTPSLWLRQRTRDERTKFEQLRRDQKSPVGLPLTSKFFHHDTLMWRSFFEKATFCFGQVWQWSAFESYLAQNARYPLNPARLITSIKDATPLYAYTNHLHLERVTQQLLPNLKHVYLDLFVTSSTHEARVIENVGIRDRCHCYNAYYCGESKGSRPNPTNSNGMRDPCDLHALPCPVKFALQGPEKICVKRKMRARYPLDQYFQPCDFVRVNFFFDGCAPEYGRLFGDCDDTSESTLLLKKRITDGYITLHLNWEMVFACKGNNHDDEIMVNASFSSSDWLVRYNWNGAEYVVPQTKPTYR